jgi:[ribosomal protein S5]-alanine N-acetyltransferase
MSAIRIETDRLLIRELQDSDLDFVAEMLGDPEVMRYWAKPYSREEAAEWIARHRKRYETDGFGYWLALSKKDARPIGQVGLLAQEFDGRKEVGLGYIIHRPFWRHGYAEEGAKACAQYGFQKLRLEKIVILIRPENEPSIELARKLGAEPITQTNYSEFVHDVFELS